MVEQRHSHPIKPRRIPRYATLSRGFSSQVVDDERCLVVVILGREAIAIRGADLADVLCRPTRQLEINVIGGHEHIDDPIEDGLPTIVLSISNQSLECWT